jgi:hypothetical protein
MGAVSQAIAILVIILFIYIAISVITPFRKG